MVLLAGVGAHEAAYSEIGDKVIADVGFERKSRYRNGSAESALPPKASVERVEDVR